MSFPAKTPATYKKLLADITRLYKNARTALARFYWETGKRIVEVEQGGDARAPKGKNLLRNLSRDLSQKLGPGFSVENLRRMRKVYLESPKQSAPTVLTWTQQVELLPVRNQKARERLEKKVIREGLTSRQIRTLVRRESTIERLKPIKGKVGIYKIVEVDGKLNWDRGFESYRELSPEQARRFKAGDLVRLKSAGKLEKVPDAKVSDLYTYEAELIRLIDADTFWKRVWTKRPEWRKEKLRLRGIDAPELSTPEGQAAKRFVEALFKKAKAITVTTTKPDKYHRYLSDVYLQMPDGEIFLNDYLLEHGHAVRTDYIPASEWEKD